VEIVSDSSVTKDTRRLPAAYFEAGVREFWLVDARGADLQFQIHHRGKTEFQPAPTDEEGFQISTVFSCRFRLAREPHPMSDWLYDLHEASI
jgi:Uma2 family endonuclease